MCRAPLALMLALLATCCADCAAGNERVLSAPEVSGQSGRHEIVLAVGASQRIADTRLTITLEAVVEDSRCPSGATCVWDGDASVRIRVDDDGRSVLRTLHTNLEAAREAEFNGLVIRLQTLTPRPTANRPPDRDAYRATFLVYRQ